MVQELIFLGHTKLSLVILSASGQTKDKLQWFKKKKKKLEYEDGEPSPEPTGIPPKKMVNIVTIILSIIITDKPFHF